MGLRKVGGVEGWGCWSRVRIREGWSCFKIECWMLSVKVDQGDVDRAMIKERRLLNKQIQ